MREMKIPVMDTGSIVDRITEVDALQDIRAKDGYRSSSVQCLGTEVVMMILGQPAPVWVRRSANP
jgi:hypothetical protein